jgi:cysteine-rich repeat protein
MWQCRWPGSHSVATVGTMVLLLASPTLSAALTVTQVIDAAGDGQGHGLDTPWGIVVDGAGNVFVAAYVTNDVLRRAPDGTITAALDASGDGLGHPMQGPNELAIGADGSVYVTALGSKNVFKRTPAGTITQIIDATGDGAGHALQYPHGLAVDAAGNAFVSDPLANRVFRIDPAGAVTSVLTQSGDGTGHTLSEPGMMVTDPAGDLYVAGERSHNVFRISPSGVVTEIANASASLYFPTALALDAAGNLYVGDFDSLRVVRVSPSGTVTLVASGLDPVALAVRPDGVVLVAESNGERISGVRPSGPRCVLVDRTGDGVHPFHFASRFALRDDGVVFASNTGYDGVFEIRDGCPAAPLVDAGGRWRVSVTYPPNDFFPPPPPSTFLQDWTQSGFDLTVSDPGTSTTTFTGTIDDRNQFVLTSVATTCAAPGVCCPAQSLSGRVADGGQDWLGALTDNFFDPHFGCGSGPFSPAAAFGTRCGNGMLDPGETCDDGNWTPADGCDAACGLGSLCGNGVLESGEGCDDGNRLAGDGCDPTCQVEHRCGDGILDAGEACDDGNAIAGDGCDLQCRVEPCYGCSGSPSSCAPALLACGGVARSRGSAVKLRASAPGRLPSLRWNLATRDPVAGDALGDPRIHTSYSLCVFDESGGTPRLLMASAFVFGPFWASSKNGFTFRAGFGDERSKIQVRGGNPGKVAARLETPTLLSLSLPVPVPLAIQLQASDAGCFDARFPAAGVRRNDAERVQAVSAP